MPRVRRPEPPVIPSTALVASATRYTGNNAPRIYRKSQDWQADCYRHYAICGEARFAAKFFGHAISRAVLRPAEVVEGRKVEVTEGPAFDAIADLFNGAQGQEQMLELIGEHLTIAGECYLVGRTVDKVEVWEIISIIEMRVTSNGRWFIEYGDGTKVDLSDSDVVIRIWLPNPERQIEPDSPFRALLPILSEIEWLTRHVFAQVSSRLAGAGILLMPDDMTFPAPPGADGQAAVAGNDADALMLTLADAMMTPLQDPGSPSALVPIIVTAPSDSIDKPRLMHFWSDLDANSMSLRSEAIRRFALGMDVPPEQILGMSSNTGTGGGTSNGVSHWGAWQIEEATIKLHIEPMLDVIVNALTIGYLRPLLGEQGTTAAILYDSSALRLRPDRSKESFELYDRGLLKAEVLLTENGFSAVDMPDEPEWKRWMLVKIASGSATPEQVQAALSALGVELGVTVVPQPAPPQLPPDPSLIGHPEQKAPDRAALIAASEALVFRALERAGNRLRQNGSKPPNVNAYEVHQFVKTREVNGLLDDAWSCAPQVLKGIADADRVVPVLNSYCQSLITEGAPHNRGRLTDWLRLAEV